MVGWCIKSIRKFGTPRECPTAKQDWLLVPAFVLVQGEGPPFSHPVLDLTKSKKVTNLSLLVLCLVSRYFSCWLMDFSVCSVPCVLLERCRVISVSFTMVHMQRGPHGITQMCSTLCGGTAQWETG